MLPTSDPEYVLSHDNINFIAKGEGEKSLLQVADAIYNKEDYKHIKGTWFKTEEGIIKNDPQSLCNINDHTPDFSLFDPRRFNRPMGGRIFKIIPIETYRGCPYKCTFCNSPMHNTNVRKEGISHSFLRRKNNR